MNFEDHNYSSKFADQDIKLEQNFLPLISSTSTNRASYNSGAAIDWGMDAGTSEPTLHQMQPARPAMMRAPHPVQRRPPTTGGLPPTMFRFQSVKPTNGQRPKVQVAPPPPPPPQSRPQPQPLKQAEPLNTGLPRNMPPPRPEKPPPYMNRQPVHRVPNSGPPPNSRKIIPPTPPLRQEVQDLTAPSTSTSEQRKDDDYTLTKFPVFDSVAEVFVNADSGQVEEDQFDADGNKIELPPNCKLFNYTCRVEGVDRTLLVPMPMDCTEEDVMKILPESFSQFAQMLKQNPPPPPRNDPTNPFATPFPHEEDNNSPYLVNQKQFLRIQRRRVIRRRLEMSGRLPLKRQKYLHESRHLHAINRKRGHDGRFDQRLNNQGADGSTNMPTQNRFAEPLSAPVTTYAEIRPAQSRQPPPLYYHPNRFRVLNQPVTNPPPNLTPVNFTSSDYHQSSEFMPSTSSSSEPITSYHQYQQHVQFPDLFSNQPRDNNEGHQKFTNL